MRAAGKVVTAAHAAAYAVLRRTPGLRLRVRRIYWALQRRRFEALTAGVAVDPRLVFFEAYGGRSYACSPKAIYQAMIADARFDGCEFVWSFREGAAPGPDEEPDLRRARCVRRGSPEYFDALSRAGAIIVNNRLPEYVYPRAGQTYVQCWHGTPLKRLGYDVAHMEAALNTADELAQRFGIDARKWTWLLSPSPFSTEHLADAFGVAPEDRPRVVLEAGYPRNDVLAQIRLTGDAELPALLREKLGIPAGKKALLYAPTWRDDSFEDGVGYTFDYLLDFDAMRAVLGDEWVVLFRPHYYIENAFDFEKYEGFVINVARVGDINDLYLAADALVTDYSSVMFDYANLRRPILLFVPDLDHYRDDVRGFYFDIREVPGPLCADTASLIAEIGRLGEYGGRYGEAYGRFVARFCPLDDGLASQRVIARVFAEVPTEAGAEAPAEAGAEAGAEAAKR